MLDRYYIHRGAHIDKTDGKYLDIIKYLFTTSREQYHFHR